jgi:hypothetical protein
MQSGTRFPINGLVAETSDCSRGVQFPEFAMTIQSRHQRPDILIYCWMTNSDHEILEKRTKEAKPQPKTMKTTNRE